jgi:hypothetical protein
LTTGISGTFSKDFQNHFIGIVLSIGLITISFIFWKLDQRIRYMIKHAETTLKEIEKNWIDESSGGAIKSIALFSAEEEKTTGIRSQPSWKPWGWHLSYSDCFRVVYFVFGALGFLGGLAASLRWLISYGRCLHYGL